jgi:membrane-associated phospholipid phosphatase
VSLLVADQFRQTLSLAFGRYWPTTWIDNNPSLIGDGAYGFHAFAHGLAFTSFSSGHMARTLGVASVVWIAYPRWRWLCVVSSLAIAIALLGMNYHFVGDVIAGSFDGAIIGAYVARWCLREKRD